MVYHLELEQWLAMDNHNVNPALKQRCAVVTRSRYTIPTVKFLIVAAALIRMKNRIFQSPMPKVHVRLLWEVLREKLNYSARLSISTAGSDHPTLHV